MVSVKHRLLEVYFRLNNPDLKVVEPEAFRALTEAARAAGVDVTYIEERGLMHDYPILNIPEARRALEQVSAYVRGEGVPQ